MPMRHEPKTLGKSCMVSIARNFDYICYNCKTISRMKEMLEDESFLNIEGPFQSLPGSLLTDMMVVIESSSTTFYIQRKHLHLLILPQIEILKLSPTSAGNSFGIELIKERCKRLRNLDLSYLVHITPPVHVRLIPSLNNLVVLNLKMTNITDQILSLIGKHCPEIKDLNIATCPITDSGIYCLCYDAEEEKTQCKKLVRINVIGCMVSSDSLWFLMQRIPTLTELEYDNILKIFSKLSNTSLDMNTINELTSQVYHLRQLTSTEGSLSNDAIEFAVHLCPMVTNITISNSIMKNETLYKIMTLQNLTHIRITNNDSLSLDFYEGVLPVLTVCGQQLISLLLTKFTMVDLTAIGECCPKLKNLALSNIGIYEEILYPKEDIFTDLNALEIWTDVLSESMNSTMLKQLLLFCPNLHNLLISGSQDLTDKLFLEILEVNEMKELSRITIDNCPNISKSTIETLLNLKNEIVFMRIWNCFLVSKEDYVYLQKKIKKENCDVYLDWYAWLG